jgi:hypothetical protein
MIGDPVAMRAAGPSTKPAGGECTHFGGLSRVGSNHIRESSGGVSFGSSGFGIRITRRSLIRASSIAPRLYFQKTRSKLPSSRIRFRPRSIRTASAVSLRLQKK